MLCHDIVSLYGADENIKRSFEGSSEKLFKLSFVIRIAPEALFLQAGDAFSALSFVSLLCQDATAFSIEFAFYIGFHIVDHQKGHCVRNRRGAR